MKERKISTKTILHEMKVHIKKKGKVQIMNFLDKGKIDIRRSFSTQEVGRKMILPWYLRNFDGALYSM